MRNFRVDVKFLSVRVESVIKIRVHCSNYYLTVDKDQRDENERGFRVS